jgi:hypothetical protein
MARGKSCKIGLQKAWFRYDVTINGGNAALCFACYWIWAMTC